MQKGTLGPYPDSDFPWNFYFNGEAMPKWGANWGMASIGEFIEARRSKFEDPWREEILDIYCSIDHVGVVESAPADVFIYAIQEILLILVGERESVVSKLGANADGIYPALLEAAFRMRSLAVAENRAFWSTGYDEERLLLVDEMRRCALPRESPDFREPPHIRRRNSELSSMRKDQLRALHRHAQSGALPKALRKRLHEL